LAVRAKVPIFVEDKVLDHAGVKLQSSPDQDESSASGPGSGEDGENLDVYRDFINSLDSLDDFGKSD